MGGGPSPRELALDDFVAGQGVNAPKIRRRWSRITNPVGIGERPSGRGHGTACRSDTSEGFIQARKAIKRAAPWVASFFSRTFGRMFLREDKHIKNPEYRPR